MEMNIRNDPIFHAESMNEQAAITKEAQQLKTGFSLKQAETLAGDLGVSTRLLEAQECYK
jgi:hypothetical protein